MAFTLHAIYLMQWNDSTKQYDTTFVEDVPIVSNDPDHGLPSYFFDCLETDDRQMYQSIEIDVENGIARHIPPVGPAPIFNTTIGEKSRMDLYNELDAWYGDNY